MGSRQRDRSGAQYHIRQSPSIRCQIPWPGQHQIPPRASVDPCLCLLTAQMLSLTCSLPQWARADWSVLGANTRLHCVTRPRKGPCLRDATWYHKQYLGECCGGHNRRLDKWVLLGARPTQLDMFHLFFSLSLLLTYFAMMEAKPGALCMVANHSTRPCVTSSAPILLLGCGCICYCS